MVERCEVAKENGGIMGKKVKFFLFFREIGIFLESSNSIYKLRKYLIVAEGKSRLQEWNKSVCNAKSRLWNQSISI